MTPGSLDALLRQVITAQARAERAARDAKVAAKALASVQKQIEAAMVGAIAGHAIVDSRKNRTGVQPDSGEEPASRPDSAG